MRNGYRQAMNTQKRVAGEKLLKHSTGDREGHIKVVTAEFAKTVVVNDGAQTVAYWVTHNTENTGGGIDAPDAKIQLQLRDREHSRGHNGVRIHSSVCEWRTQLQLNNAASLTNIAHTKGNGWFGGIFKQTQNCGYFGRR